VTILIIGRDTRDTENDVGRADTIMLLHLNPEGKRAALLSIPRDTLIEIEGYGEDKINTAYAYGREELMIKTVSDFLDAEINHYITLDFDGFVKMIDELGGVDVTIDRPLVDEKSGANFSPGEHHLTGEQALSFTRSRSTEFGDIGRIQRQQYIFYQLIQQKLNASYLSKIPYYFDILIDNTRTDIDVMTLLAYSKAALNFSLENIDSAIIPSHPDWINNGNGNISVQVPDIEESRAMWERIISGEPISKYGAQYFELEEIPESMGQSLVYYLKVKAKNTGALNWDRGGENPIYISYHWLDFEDKKIIVFEGERTLLPKDLVQVGEEAEINMKVMSPSEPGKYILQIDLVNEGVTWFSYQGVPQLEKYIAVDVAYAAQYDDSGTTPNYMDPGQIFETEVTAKNNGFLLWENDKQIGRVNLGVHWINRDTGTAVIWDGDSGELPFYVNHGESAVVNMKIKVPDEPGRYILQYDLVHEGVAWFSEKGVIPLEINIDVGKTLDKSIAKSTSIKIFNGNGTRGCAGEFKEFLEAYGFKIDSLANAEKFDFEKSVIIYKEDSKEKAEQLALVLKSCELESYSSKWSHYDTSADLILILGDDYKENMQL